MEGRLTRILDGRCLIQGVFRNTCIHFGTIASGWSRQRGYLRREFGWTLTSLRGQVRNELL